jgi:hypothetical protein
MTHQVIRDTKYYLKGPQQGSGPDGTFQAGIKVKMLEERPAYSRVESENGIAAWVKTDDLKSLCVRSTRD